jgi:hypothetical protein
VQGSTAISSTGLRLDGGRIFRNEGTLTQTGNVDLNSRVFGIVEAGNGSVTDAGTWNASSGTLNFNAPHTISGSGEFLQTFGQVTGANLTLGQSLATNISLNRATTQRQEGRSGKGVAAQEGATLSHDDLQRSRVLRCKYRERMHMEPPKPRAGPVR